jgi:voltage-gated sodium channel
LEHPIPFAAERFDVRAAVQRLVASSAFQGLILALILVNGAVLGLDTFAEGEGSDHALLRRIDQAIIWLFVAEIGLRIWAEGWRYPRDGWNIFDFLVVAVSLFATASGLGALRAFRVLRVLRVVTAMPRMRLVVSSLFSAIPGIASVGVVLVLILYVFGVIAATLYGADHPERFGDVLRAMFTLFQVMTLEGWPDIAGEVIDTHPRAWAFFVAFILIATFTMLNLFVAIVVRVVEDDASAAVAAIKAETEALRADIAEVKAMIAQLGARDRP